MGNKRDNKQKSAGRIIGELSRAAHVYFQSEFKNYSIGHGQIRTLLHIEQHGGESQLELAKHLSLDKSSITSQLQTLEKNGYIKRTVSESDARVYQIFVTEKTREILEPLKQVFSSWTETLLNGFQNDEKEKLFEFLERMRTNAKMKINEIKKK